MDRNNEITEHKSIVVDRRGQPHEVVGAATVPPGQARRDICAEEAALRHRLWYQFHNPTPGHPIQGRKRGMGKNRKKARGAAPKEAK